MDLRRAFAYLFNDSKWWLIILIAFICNITLIGQPLTVGYALRTSRCFLRGRPLPKWEDWVGLYLDGMRVIALVLGYVFPGMLIIFCGAFSVIFYGMMGGNEEILRLLSGICVVLSVVGGGMVFIGTAAAVIAYMLLLGEGAGLKKSLNYNLVFGMFSGLRPEVFKFLAVSFAVHMLFSTLGLGAGFALHHLFEETIADYIGMSLFCPCAVLVTAVLPAQLAKKHLPKAAD